MASVAVAMDAGGQLAVRCSHAHLMHDIGMTMDAGTLRYPAVARFDLDRFVKVFERKGQRMEKAIVGLGNPFAQKVVGQVTIVTDSHMAMAGVLPRVVMIVHHVTVGARFRIVAEVACALPVAKGEYADARKYAQHDRQDN